MLFTSVLAALAAAGTAVAQLEGDVHCDGLMYPDYANCDAHVYDENAWDGEISWDGNSPNNCYIWFGSGNCKMGYCFFNPGSYYQWVLPIYYEMVKQSCQSFDAGGRVSLAEADLFEVSHSSDFRPDSRRRDTLMSINVSKEDYDILMNSTQKIVSPEADNPPEADSSKIIKRQQNEFVARFSAFRVTKPGKRDRAGPISDGGAEYGYTRGEGFSHTVETSIEAGVGLFEVFTSSVSISTSETHSVEFSETLNFVVNCNPGQSGQVYYYPLYNYWRGYFTDNPNQEEEVWVPVGDNESEGRFETECLGPA